MATSIENIKWKAIPFRPSKPAVPKTCGLYAIGYTRSYGGLEIENTFVYIGQTSNINKRFTQHLPQNEHSNHELKKYISKHLKKMKFWYVTLRELDKIEREKMEKRLIRYFNPDYNTQHSLAGDNVND